MALVGSSFMPRNKLSLPISTSKFHPQKAVKIIRCGKPPRKEASKGRPPQINNVLTVADTSMAAMENTAAAVSNLKMNVEEESYNRTKAKVSACSTGQNQATEE